MKLFNDITFIKKNFILIYFLVDTYPIFLIFFVLFGIWFNNIPIYVLSSLISVVVEPRRIYKILLRIKVRNNFLCSILSVQHRIFFIADQNLVTYFLIHYNYIRTVYGMVYQRVCSINCTKNCYRSGCILRFLFIFF